MARLQGENFKIEKKYVCYIIRKLLINEMQLGDRDMESTKNNYGYLMAIKACHCVGAILGFVECLMSDVYPMLQDL